MPRKCFNQSARLKSAKTGIFQRREVRLQSWLGIAQDYGPKHCAEYEPVRAHILFAPFGPGNVPATHQPAIHEQSIRPFKINQSFRRRVNGERIGECIHPGVNDTARGSQRLFGFEHHGEFDKIKSSDPYESPSALLGCYFLGMFKGPVFFSQRDQVKGWRQIEIGPAFVMDVLSHVDGHCNSKGYFLRIIDDNLSMRPAKPR